MIPTFDGPAAGEHLPIERAPRYLRVTQNGITFRALDQLDDEPEETEIIYVYHLTGSRSGIPRYTYLPNQPADPLVRKDYEWRGWVTRRIQSIQQQHAP